MTSPFEWKGKPSKLAQELKEHEAKQRHSQQGGIKRSEQLTPKRFHVYSKAVPNSK